MDIELKILLKIITGDYDFAIPGPVDTKRLIRISFRHKLVYQMLLFAQKKPELFTPQQIEKLNERNRKVARQSLVQLQEMKKIAGIFNKKGIGYICIKGPQLSRMLYGREALKDSVDLDIILTNAKYLQDIHDLLNQYGYTQSNLNDYPGRWRRKIFLIAKREVHYHNPGNNISIDLHIRPGANTYLTEKLFTPFLENLQHFNLEGSSIPVPDLNYYFVYLCYHGALHQFIRLAWLLDIRAFLIRYGNELDPVTIFDLSRKMNIERCVLLALYLLKENFGDHFFSPQPFYPARVESLARRCRTNWTSKPGYSLSLKGRFDKVMFIMKLLKGIPAKIDWIYGILVRQLINLPLIRRS